MIFKDLLEQCDRAKLLDYLVKIDEFNSRETYQSLLDNLDKITPANSEMTICVRKMTIKKDNTTFLDVFGTKPDDEDTYALEFMAWAEWLGSEINEKDLEARGLIPFCGEVLFEMSFISFDQNEILSVFEGIKDAVAEVEDGEV